MTTPKPHSKRPKPNWVIYKNDQAIGQSVTWHGALDVLVKQEHLSYFMIDALHSCIVFVTPFHTLDTRYKIQKES